MASRKMHPIILAGLHLAWYSHVLFSFLCVNIIVVFIKVVVLDLTSCYLCALYLDEDFVFTDSAAINKIWVKNLERKVQEY